MRGDRSSIRSEAPGRLPALRRTERDHRQANRPRWLAFCVSRPVREEMGYFDKGCVYRLLPRAGPRGRLVTVFPVWVGFAAPILLMVLARRAREISFRRAALPATFWVALLTGLFGLTFIAKAAA